ncbi:MAG: hypothetical protein GXP59_02390 [Deltaproteobacteria bacterium]|nr:hypothetical protein [Deltaproteobacteria bacterium]
MSKDIEAGLRQKLAEALHQAVVTSLTKSGKGAVSLSAAQRQALDSMAQDTAAMLETEIKPLLVANARAGVAKLSWMRGSFAKLQKTKLALQLRPVDANDATLKLVKSLVQLVLNKLNDPKSRNILNIDMLGNVRDLF